MKYFILKYEKNHENFSNISRNYIFTIK